MCVYAEEFLFIVSKFYFQIEREGGERENSYTFRKVFSWKQQRIFVIIMDFTSGTVRNKF